MNKAGKFHGSVSAIPRTSARSVSIDWYAEGESRTVEIDGVHVTVRFIGRKGRRGRIRIEAPAGAVFQNNGVNAAHERSAG